MITYVSEKVLSMLETILSTPFIDNDSEINGLFDIHGNAWEWVYDWFGIYTADNVSNSQGPEIGKYRVLRGGSWTNPPEYLRSAMRRDALPTSTSNNVGFRCAAKK